MTIIGQKTFFISILNHLLGLSHDGTNMKKAWNGINAEFEYKVTCMYLILSLGLFYDSIIR
jgi:hypothetical protein